MVYQKKNARNEVTVRWQATWHWAVDMLSLPFELIKSASQTAMQATKSKVKPNQAGKPTDMLNYANLISMNEWSVEWVTAWWAAHTHTHRSICAHDWLPGWVSGCLRGRVRRLNDGRCLPSLWKCANAQMRDRKEGCSYVFFLAYMRAL